MAWRVLTALALLGLLAGLWAVWPFSVDDSYIVAQYAKRLAGGLGYTFRSGPATDGVTGPLWLLPLTLAARLGLDAALASKALGGVCSLLTVGLLLRALRDRQRGLPAAALATAFLLSSVPFLTWAVAGLETGAAGLASLVLALAVTARPGVHVAGAALAAACLPWLRPELVPFAATLLAYAYVRDPRAGTRALAAFTLALLALLLFRLLSFGHLLPMASAAKPPVLAQGASYVFSAGVRLSTVLLLIALGWGLCASTGRERALVSALLVHALAVLLAGGDWMPGLRLFAPVAAVTALVLGAALARRGVRASSRALVLAGLLLAARAHETVGEVMEARRGGFELARTARELTQTLRDADGAIVALDVGALAYGLPNDVIDLGGLTEPQVAYAAGGHLAKHVDETWLRDQHPARLVLHSRERPRVDEQGHVRWFAGFPVERRVLGMRWVLEDYRVVRVLEHAANYHYLVLAPRSTPISRVVSRTTDLVRDPSHAVDLRRLVRPGVLAP